MLGIKFQNCGYPTKRAQTMNFAPIILDQYKNPVDENGTTPFHLAAENGHYNICKSILDEVYHKNPKNLSEKTPLLMAEKAGHHKICDMIRNKLQDQ